MTIFPITKYRIYFLHVLNETFNAAYRIPANQTENDILF